MNTLIRTLYHYLPVLLLWLAGSTVLAAAVIKPFTSDGCSLFPDGNLKQREKWLPCCIEHDRAYWQGGTWSQRLDADRQLKYCVSRLGEPVIAELMLNGVRIGGSPYWPTHFRWGYGWDYLRGYKPLDEDERRAIDKAWREYKANQGMATPSR